MNGLTRPNLPLMVEIMRVVKNADVEEVFDEVEDEDYAMMLRDFRRSVERVFERIVEESYVELSQEQLVTIDVVLRAQAILMLADQVFGLVSRLNESQLSPLFLQLNYVLFPESSHT